jgi:hypothetical protein
VNSALFGDGQTIACEIVVAGIGARPVTELLANTGIEVADESSARTGLLLITVERGAPRIMTEPQLRNPALPNVASQSSKT